MLHIPKQVKNIIDKLTYEGYKPYIFGGAVRDYLLDLKPNDFDILVDGKTIDIYTLLGNIGKIKTKKSQYQGKDIDIKSIKIKLPNNKSMDIVPYQEYSSTINHPINQGDFTINSILYEPKEKKIIDITGKGLDDIKQRIIRFNGCPEGRIEEDNIRCLRGIRFHKKIKGSKFDYDTRIEIKKNIKDVVLHSDKKRFFNEIKKWR